MRPTAEPPVINEPQPWKLDPLPLILDDREWSRLETGLVQRAELLDAIMADLYGARSLLARARCRRVPSSTTTSTCVR